MWLQSRAFSLKGERSALPAIKSCMDLHVVCFIQSLNGLLYSPDLPTAPSWLPWPVAIAVDVEAVLPVCSLLCTALFYPLEMVLLCPIIRI